jgi:hypothetical protein
MRKVFLSHSFNDRDRPLVAYAESLIRSHGLFATTGARLGGGPLTPEIKTSIDDADALVALLTVRENDPPHVTHPWVKDEFAYARLGGKNAIAVYETGVAVEGVDGGYEHINYDAESPAAALVRLTETLGEWKRRAGRLFKIQVMPEQAARELGPRADHVRCECRFAIAGKDTEWRTVRVKREVGGVFVYVQVPEAAEMVQVRSDGPSFESAFTPLAMPVHFEPRT